MNKTTSPLPLTAEMAAAWHKGLKTESRRPIKPQPIEVTGSGKRVYRDEDYCKSWEGTLYGDCTHQPGDIVWIREPGRIADLDGKNVTINYLADDDMIIFDLPERLCGRAWVEKCHGIPNGIFREACRSWGKVLSVRAERVQDITEESAIAEGIPAIAEGYEDCGPWVDGPESTTRDPVVAFAALWDSIYASRGLGWDANPWVWAHTFEKCDRPEGW